MVKVDQGGMYLATGAGDSFSSYDFFVQPTETRGDVRQGTTCVVFSSAGTIRLTKTPDGSRFGLSILAPYVHVIVDSDAGSVDSFMIAKSYSSSGGNAGSVELHGNGYREPFECTHTMASYRHLNRDRRANILHYISLGDTSLGRMHGRMRSLALTCTWDHVRAPLARAPTKL